MPDAFDLSAYLTRIGSPPLDGVSLVTLRRLHRAHIEAIPFENLDIQMGRPVGLDPASLRAALVERRRGGYCFQQNALFALALAALGFEPRMREGRVTFGRLDPAPRTHMLLVVAVDRRDWLLDVGFGAEGIVEPLAMDGQSADQDGWRYRVVQGAGGSVLQRVSRDGWTDLYVFAPHDVPPIDYAVGHWYTSTHPDSVFVTTLTAQRMLADSRHSLRNLTYSVASRGGEWEARTIPRDALVPLLRDTFSLDVPATARFRALDGEPTSG